MSETYGNLAYKKEPRTEVIGGKVVMFAAPLADHEYITDTIYNIFYDYLRGKPCRVYSSNWGVYLDDGEEYLPDVKVVCDRSKIQRDGIHGAPDLVVEVLSRSTGRYDRGHKKQVYERCGVREYWIVDTKNRSIEQYVLENGKFILRGYAQQPDQEELEYMKEEERAKITGEFHCALFEDLTISVDDVFADVQDW